MATSNLRFRIIGEDDASHTFLEVAAAAQVASSAMGKWTQIAVSSASVVPVFAAASASLIELSTSAAAGAGALGIFGLSVAGIGKDMVDAQTNITAAQKKLAGLTAGTTEYKAALLDLRTQQKDFNKQFGPAAKGLRDVRTAFSEFKFATGKVTTGVMGKAFELLAKVLPKLAPVANAAGRAVGGLIDDLSGWTKSPAFDGLLHWFKTSGPKAITHFGHIIGNVVDGLGGILSNFVGPGDKAAKSLDKLTKRFADWGHSKGVSDSVDKFLKYVSDNGPKVSSVIASLATILPKLAIAFGQLGSLQLGAVSLFLNLLSGMSQGTFNVVVKGLFAIVVASKALAIATAIGNIAAGVSLTLLKARTVGTVEYTVVSKVAAAATKAWTAAQWLLDAALTDNPIGLVVVALAALAVGLVIAYKKSETFRNIVNGAFHGVQKVAAKVLGWLKGAVGATIGFVKSHWMLLLGILGGPIALAAVLIVKNFGKIKSAVSNAVGAVVGFVKSHWQLLVGLIGGPIALAAALVIRNFDKMKAGVSNTVGAVLGFVRSIPGKIRGALGDLGGMLYQAGKDIINGLWNGIKAQVGGLLSYVGSVAGKISSTFKNALHIGSPSKVFRGYGQAIMEGLLQGIADKELSVQAAMARVAASIQKAGDLISHQLDKIASLQGTRQGFLGTFTADSVFAQDLSTTTTDAAGNDVTTPGTIADAIRFQKQQADQARRLARDVRNVTKRGLSKALVKQLQSEGTAGAATLHALAQGSKHDIDRLNRLNKQTSESLRHAGLTAGNFVRGGSINKDIRIAEKQEHTLERQEDILKRLEHHLQDIAHSQKKNQTIVVEIDGQAVVTAIRRTTHTKGKKSSV